MNVRDHIDNQLQVKLEEIMEDLHITIDDFDKGAYEMYWIYVEAIGDYLHGTYRAVHGPDC